MFSIKVDKVIHGEAAWNLVKNISYIEKPDSSQEYVVVLLTMDVTAVKESCRVQADPDLVIKDGSTIARTYHFAKETVMDLPLLSDKYFVKPGKTKAYTAFLAPKGEYDQLVFSKSKGRLFFSLTQEAAANPAPANSR